MYKTTNSEEQAHSIDPKSSIKGVTYQTAERRKVCLGSSIANE